MNKTVSKQNLIYFNFRTTSFYKTIIYSTLPSQKKIIALKKKCHYELVFLNIKQKVEIKKLKLKRYITHLKSLLFVFLDCHSYLVFLLDNYLKASYILKVKYIVIV